MRFVVVRRSLALALVVAALPSRPFALELTILREAGCYEVMEFGLSGAPAASRPFDPDAIRIDAAFTLPSGREIRVPAFWFQDYEATQPNGREVLRPRGEPGWRIRFTPRNAGAYQVQVEVRIPGEPVRSGEPLRFIVADPAEGPRPGFPRLAAHGRYFETDDGEPVPLVGHCVCWHHEGGTADYRQWFASMAEARENYTRLWMAPWAFGIETDPGAGTNYRLDRAWQLDAVFGMAREAGLWLMLCFDYHGMFETQPDYWGGNDNWKINPYNQANGGPCANQNEFFTLPAARTMYQKRLRYLIARYGAFPNLLAWQFFNEIDNVYRYLEPQDVAAWHAAMGEWLKDHDPWHHLVTTSLTGGSERPEIWRLPQLDFSMYHSYRQAQPAAELPKIVRRFLDRYDKPMMIGEFGTDWQGWKREQDPFLRGWRQGIWAGALSGSVGTSMSWWWESIEAEHLYGTFRPLGDFLRRSSLPRGAWQPLVFAEPDAPPTEIGDQIPEGSRFDTQLALNTEWAASVSGSLAIANPSSAATSPAHLNAYVHGTSHANLRRPFRISAWFAADAQLVLHLNAVSEGAVLSVLVDDTEIQRRPLPNRDGKHEVNDEYDEDIVVAIPAGKHRVEVRNAGADWFYLDWVRLEGLLPAEYSGGWQPALVACGLEGADEALVYVVNPAINYPANASLSQVPPARAQTMRVPAHLTGRFTVLWYDPQQGGLNTRTVAVGNGEVLEIAVPELPEDLAGHLLPEDRLSLGAPRLSPDRGFRFALTTDRSGHFTVERSIDFADWEPTVSRELGAGQNDFAVTTAPGLRQAFYRARRED